MVIKVGMISFAHIHASAYADCLKQIPEQARLAGILTITWNEHEPRTAV